MIEERKVYKIYNPIHDMYYGSRGVDLWSKEGYEWDSMPKLKKHLKYLDKYAPDVIDKFETIIRTDLGAVHLFLPVAKLSKGDKLSVIFKKRS